MNLEDGNRLREDDIAIVIPKELYVKADKAAEKKGISSTSDLIRMILWDCLEDIDQA